jgi:eukaryotic-like serine/threonine-protein kinase
MGALSEQTDIRAQERVGTVLNDKWTLERVLGVGGMAAVYAARHRNGARAAVKVLHADLSRHADVRERFLREGYAANKVEHPGVVKVLDDDVIAAGRDSGTAYLVMELLEGESMQDRLERDPPMGEREFLAIAERVLEVLEAAHSRGVVHRDLKPENLFLLGAKHEGAAAADDGTIRVKVLDFGLARLLQGQTITTYGLALGTPSFMSPEQASGRVDEIDGRTDLFALAATGFRLRTGRRIQEGANPVELVTKMANVPAPRIRTLAPNVSAPFARVVDRALEFRREDRYESAAAMLQDVRKAIVELDAGAGATQLALPAPLRDTTRSESTIEASESDFERSPSALDTSPLPAARTGRAAEQSEASIALPRRRPILLLLPLLVLGGIGAKVWLDARRAPVTREGPATQAAVVAPVESASSTAEQARDAGAETAMDAASNGIVASPTLHAAVPPSSVRRPPPANVGVGNVHKVPVTHHAASAGQKSGRPGTVQ